MTNSAQYRLMIYFAHSTLVLYSASVTTAPDMSPAAFLETNAAACKRVCEEALKYFQYELSHEQLCKAAYCYLDATYRPQSA